MKIKSIRIDGFRNILNTKIECSNIIAILSENNYGKSNLFEAIDFGTEFLINSPKRRKSMMKWKRGIPLNPETVNNEFTYEIELYDDSLDNYRFVKYGYSFKWYRDDNSGQKISDEWIEARNNESVRYTSYLKRADGMYRKSKQTSAYCNINLDDGQLAIDILTSINDIDINPVIKAIQKIDFHMCSSLDLGDRYQAPPFEYIDAKDDGVINFDDQDVPKALYMLKEHYPEKYNLFCEAVFELFPDFRKIDIQVLDSKQNMDLQIAVMSEKEGKLVQEELPPSDIPFRIKDVIYRIYITSININQPINMTMMSTGTKRIFWLLENIFIANCKNLCLIGVEELETSIHPKLLKKLLEVLDENICDTSIIISSHSPFLVQYIKPDRIYIGVPNNKGTASFKKILPKKIKTFVTSARDNGMSVGEYLFDLMSGDNDSSVILSSYLEDN